MNILKMTEQIFFKLRGSLETVITDVLPVYTCSAKSANSNALLP